MYTLPHFGAVSGGKKRPIVERPFICLIFAAGTTCALLVQHDRYQPDYPLRRYGLTAREEPTKNQRRKPHVASRRFETH
jgi:hypothetical protein